MTIKYSLGVAFRQAKTPLGDFSTISRREFAASVRAMRSCPGMYAFLALMGIVLEGVLLFWSLKYTTAARSSLFANTSPIFTALLAAFILREGLDRRKAIGMAIGFAGVAVAIVSRGAGDLYLTAASVAGDLLALGSGVCWAAYTVWGMEATRKHGSLTSTIVVVWLGTAMLLALTLVMRRPMVWALPLRLWLAILYLGVIANGVALVCWFAALKYLKAGEVGAFGYVSAILTMLLSCALLHERFGVGFFLAMFGVFAGVYLMMERKPGVVVNREANDRRGTGASGDRGARRAPPGGYP